MALWLQLVLAAVLAVVAGVYASVGLAGGTAYLSVLSFFDTDPDSLRPIAWTLNVIVAAVGFWQFRRKGHFQARFAWPFLVGGCAGGMIGAALPMNELAFAGLLALTLIAAAARMLVGRKPVQRDEARVRPWPLTLTLGFVVGILSGLVGIGGGIILGPIVIALGWMDIKRTAAMTSLYILVVSAGALAGFFVRGGTLDWGQIAIWSGFVVVGGFVGARWGAGRASPRALQLVFGGVALVAGVRLAVRFVTGLLGADG